MSDQERGYWRADRSRYGRLAMLDQPALWAIAVYRFGRWTAHARFGKAALRGVYFFLYSVVRLMTGIDIPRSARIGPGLLIHHFGGIIIHPESQIGSRCVMRHGVTIGARDSSGPPVLGDGVVLGAYAQVLGSITVGDDAVIGAMTVVLEDVPRGGVVVGTAGRLLQKRAHE